MPPKGKLKTLTVPKLRRLLKDNQGKVKQVAEQLNVTDQAIYAWMRAHNCRLSNTIVCELEPPETQAAK